MERSGSNFNITMNRKRESRILYVGFIYKINSGIKSKDRKKTPDGEDYNDDNDY